MDTSASDADDTHRTSRYRIVISLQGVLGASGGIQRIAMLFVLDAIVT